MLSHMRAPLSSPSPFPCRVRQVQDMHPKEGQEEGQEGPDAAGFPSQWLGSETAWHTTLRRTQSK